jgi:hypothetical protein
MKKLLLLFGFIFFFSNADAQELAYAETNTDLPAMTSVKFTVSSIYRDSLFWVVDIDIRPIETGSWSSKASFQTKNKPSGFSKGSNGIGDLEVVSRKTGRLEITEMNGRKIPRPQTVNLKFWGRPPSLK